MQVIQRKKYKKYEKPPPHGCPPLLSILIMPLTFGLDSWADLIRRKQREEQEMLDYLLSRAGKYYEGDDDVIQERL